MYFKTQKVKKKKEVVAYRFFLISVPSSNPHSSLLPADQWTTVIHFLPKCIFVSNFLLQMVA